MKAGETRSHTEYWYPTNKPLDIYTLALPSLTLRPLREIPLFGWARKQEVDVWHKLIAAYAAKAKLPAAPEVASALWPPSGMENLNAPFKWAVQSSTGSSRDSWMFYHGSWLAGRGDTAAAIRVLSETKSGVAKVLLARLLKLNGNPEAARKAFASIQETWLQMHPQVVVERDKLLRTFGSSSIPERELWLSKVPALKDEWVIERRVQLHIDKGELEAARKLLLAIPFQKVHQTYTRTGLWMQLCEKLGLPCVPIPAQLGEDRLARFGAYREYE
jgi:hypothetical protein